MFVGENIFQPKQEIFYALESMKSGTFEKIFEHIILRIIIIIIIKANETRKIVIIHFLASFYIFTRVISRTQIQ